MFRIIRPITSSIDSVINVFIQIFNKIFVYSADGYMYQLVNTIVTNPLLLVCFTLLVCGFVIGVLKRLISL